MALLETLQEVAELGGLPRPTAIVGSTDTTARQLLAIANERGQEAARLYDWPQLIISSTLTLVANEIQPLPYDVAEVLDLTAWYSADMTPLTGPITYIEWQRMKQTAVAPIKYSFRVANTSFGKPALAFVPTPTGGQIISYYYRTKAWAKPQDWRAAWVVTTGLWCYSDGKAWKANSSGTTGTNAPSSANGGNDGVIVWTAQPTTIYNKFLADTDESLIPLDVLKKGILSRFYRMKGLEYQDLEAEYQRDLRDEMAERTGGRTVNLFRTYGRFIDESNIKEGNW
ncbi:MAG: hypothetical protein ACO3EZ_18645 [Prochlorotrichaceae cyanobacterium]